MKEVMFSPLSVRLCLSVFPFVRLSARLLKKSFERSLMRFLGRVRRDLWNNRLDFGADLVHDPDSEIFKGCVYSRLY